MTNLSWIDLCLVHPRHVLLRQVWVRFWHSVYFEIIFYSLSSWKYYVFMKSVWLFCKNFPFYDDWCPRSICFLSIQQSFYDQDSKTSKLTCPCLTSSFLDMHRWLNLLTTSLFEVIPNTRLKPSGINFVVSERGFFFF